MCSIKSWLVRALLLALGCALAACATVPNLPPLQPNEVLRDQLFAPGKQTINTADVFALSPAMVQHLESAEFRTLVRTRGLRQGLIDALYSKAQLRLEYDAGMTRNAAQAFEARSGNCMSLVLMTAAFAKHLELPVRFNNVYVDESWSRSGDLYFLSGHVNLSLGAQPFKAMRNMISLDESLTIDFLPADMLRKQRSHNIDESTIVAMYMNNRAAENLNDGLIDEAYWWARAAVMADSKYMAAYNTLGVIYRRHGNLDAAEQAMRKVLEREPENVHSMSNMALVLRDQGRSAEAATLTAKLRELQPYPPFWFFDKGVVAMQAGNYGEARELFSREIARSAYFHQFHFWMALADFGLGDIGDARKHMELALENSTTVKERELYGAKLSWLQAQKRSPLYR